MEKRRPRLRLDDATAPVLGATVAGRDAFAAALGIDPVDLLAAAPVQVVSCGVPFLFAALATRRAVDHVTLDRARYRAVLAASSVAELPVFVFTLDVGGASGDETVYSRMLAPGFGIAEDPATGGASGPLGCYLADHRLLDATRLSQFVSLGVAMQRPSRIHIGIDTGCRRASHESGSAAEACSSEKGTSAFRYRPNCGGG